MGEKIMLFCNTTGKKLKIRKHDKNGFFWVDLNPNEKINIPEEYGHNIGLSKVIETKKDKESKQEHKEKKEAFFSQFSKKDETEHNQEDFYQEIKSIKGIGKKTAEDIVAAFQTKEQLISAIKSGEHLPVRNDVENKLKAYYSEK